jgi:exopolysaccharide production protein ExoZ
MQKILPSKNMLIGVQLLRAIAVISVVLFHIKEYLHKYLGVGEFFDVFHFGDSGVQIFFMVSGYIIYYVHSHELGLITKFKSYLLKRILRIYPPYLVISSLLVFYCFPRNSCGASYHHDFSSVLLSMFLIPENHSPYLGVGWTLTHEMFFYLLFSTLILSKKIGTILILTWSLAISYFSIFVDTDSYPVASSLFPYSFFLSTNNLFFVIGLLTAYLQTNPIKSVNTNNFKVTSSKCFSCGFLVWVFYACLSNTVNTNLHIMYLLLVTSVVTMLFFSNFMPKQSLQKAFVPVLYIGNLSYSIYLVHNAAFSFVIPVLQGLGIKQPNLLGILLFITAISSGAIFYSFVEKPLLKWSKATVLSGVKNS